MLGPDRQWVAEQLSTGVAQCEAILQPLLSEELPSALAISRLARWYVAYYGLTDYRL